MGVSRSPAEQFFQRFRWMPYSQTTNSGKMQFLCTCCGRISVGPDKECPPKDGIEMHCREWPLHDDHFTARYGMKRIIERAMEDRILFVPYSYPETPSNVSSDVFIIELPWAPSTNKMWKRTRRGMSLTDEAKAFYENATVGIIQQGLKNYQWSHRSRVNLHMHFPYDYRVIKGDLDNRIKCSLDALTKGLVWTDDDLVDELHVYRHAPSDPKGKVLVVVEKMED
jgi:Holliday junction resolvase RusA-like endonuclease